MRAVANIFVSDFSTFHFRFLTVIMCCAQALISMAALVLSTYASPTIRHSAIEARGTVSFALSLIIHQINWYGRTPPWKWVYAQAILVPTVQIYPSTQSREAVSISMAAWYSSTRISRLRASLMTLHARFSSEIQLKWTEHVRCLIRNTGTLDVSQSKAPPTSSSSLAGHGISLVFREQRRTQLISMTLQALSIAPKMGTLSEFDQQKQIEYFVRNWAC